MKLIILDRDGVINFDSAQFIKSPDEWKPIPGSLAAIARLNQSGYRVVVATNQSGVGRGLFEMDTLNAIHEKMHKALAQAGVTPGQAVHIGDHPAQDVAAAQAAGLRSVWVNLTNAEWPLSRRPDAEIRHFARAHSAK